MPLEGKRQRETAPAPGCAGSDREGAAGPGDAGAAEGGGDGGVKSPLAVELLDALRDKVHCSGVSVLPCGSWTPTRSVSQFPRGHPVVPEGPMGCSWVLGHGLLSAAVERCGQCTPHTNSSYTRAASDAALALL